MKFIHVADIHASRERLTQTLKIIDTLTERAGKGDIDFIVFAGDFWDSTITATKGSGFSDIVRAIRKLQRITHLYFIYGTPTHEPSGSLDAFCFSGTDVVDDMTCIDNKLCRIVCIPEPRRSRYAADSIQGTNELINSTIEKWVGSVRDLHEKNKEYLPILGSYEYDKPLIVVYHGEVKGAVYQNGTAASSPTAIPKKLLQSLNADYYALGHIHMPQEVFPNAWYPGSACPKNFGEVHDGHYNLVTVKNGKTEVEQVSFGLPIYQTYRVNYPFESPHGDWSNYHIRLQFDCTKEERKTLNIKEISDSIKERTHAISVKIEPNVIEGEIIQTSEVSKRKSIVEKMIEYAKEKELKVPKYAKELLQNIQDNTLAKLAYPQHSFELLSLSLRGAIGIRDGQHKEDYELNFEHLEDGIVCLVGFSGTGKSTILENCHPYPYMLTRSGTLKDHFYLKDSHRILLYRDENELFYKISMFINGSAESGKEEYHVETSRDKKSWKSILDGVGIKEYKEWVESTFGSIDIFLRTAFFAKEQTKDAVDISVTTKGERMELLSKLAGTDHLKVVSEIARNLRAGNKQKKIIGLEDTAEKLKDEIESYSSYEEIIKQNEKDIAFWNKKLEEQKESISVLEKVLEELKVKDTEYQKAKAVNEARNALYEQYQKSYAETKESYDKFDKVVSSSAVYDRIGECNKIIADNAPLIEQKMEDIKAKEEELEAQRKKLFKLNADLSDKKVEIEKINSSIKICKSQIVKIDDICPTCGQPINEHKRNELQTHIDKSKEELGELEEKKTSLISDQDNLKSVCAKTESIITTLEDDIVQIESSLADLQSESQSCSELLESLDQIFFEYSYDDAVEEHQKLSKELDSLQSKLSTLGNENSVEDVSVELKKTERNLKDETDNLNDIIVSIKSAEKENERYKKELECAADKKRELKELQEKITAYSFIESAFSNSGIPAIELRESAPEIADITNKILKESFGNKFAIRFGSTSELKTKRKADEDFNILVYDSENNDEKTIDLVSSGEKIWIKQALFYAFSIVQMNRTGFNFRTRLIDESDGSLDGASRPKYLQMVAAAHKYSSSRITLMITHSQEIKDIAGQIIEL